MSISHHCSHLISRKINGPICVWQSTTCSKYKFCFNLIGRSLHTDLWLVQCLRCVLQWTWRSANSWGNCANGTAGLPSDGVKNDTYGYDVLRNFINYFVLWQKICQLNIYKFQKTVSCFVQIAAKYFVRSAYSRLRLTRERKWSGWNNSDPWPET